MRTVYKYPMELTDITSVSVPMGALIRDVGIDWEGRLCVWLEVDTENPMELLRFRVAGTGHPLRCKGMEKEDCLRFLKTVPNKPFFWHVYEIVNQADALVASFIK